MVSRAGHGRAGDGGRAARRLAALLALILAGPLAGSLHFKENWLWMDEVLSFLLITDPSIQHMNAAIVSGMDANPPLFPNVYWVLAHAVAANPYFLRDVSIVLFALTAAVFYWYIDRLRRAPALNFLLVLATLATTYLNFTLATQVRSYALFLAVAAGYFISAHRLLLRPGGRAEWLWHTGAGLLLVFTHNFGLFYLAVSGAGFGVLALVDRRAASWLPLASLAVILGAWVQFWMPSFLIQARAGDPHSWIPLPTWRTFFATAGELAPSLSSRLERVPGLVVLPILRCGFFPAIFIYLVQRRLREGIQRWRHDPAFLFYLYAGVCSFGTVALALGVSLTATSVFLSRYLWPSHLLLMYQFVYAWHEFFGRTEPRLAGPGRRAALAAVAGLAGALIFHQNRKVVIFPRGIVPSLRALPPGAPIFVETADYFLPLRFQEPELSVHYVLDWTTAARPGNLPSATVENRILAGVREHYRVPGIETLRDFNARRFPAFFAVDEQAVYQFENYLDSGRVVATGQRPAAVPGHRLLECRFRAGRAMSAPVLAPPPPAERPAGNSTRRFARNVLALASVQVANMLLPLATVPYLVRIIGPARLGLLSFSQAYITYFALLINYGFEISAVRAIAADRDNRANTNRIFNEVIAGKALLWLVATGLFTGITLAAPELRGHLALHLCTFLSCVGTVLFPLWLYQAMEDLGRVAIFNLLVRLLFSAAIFLFIRKPEDYLYQNLAISVAQVLVGIAAFRIALRRFRLAFSWPGAASLARRFREDRTLFLSSVMITLYASSSTFLLGLRATSYSVGIYAAGVRLESIARTFFSLALNQAFFPVVAHAFGRGREAGLALIRRALLPLTAGLTVISLGLWVIAPFFIHLFYGPAFAGAVPVLRLASVLTITIGLSNLLGFHVMLNLRHDRAFFAITTGGSLLGLALTWFLVGSYQEIGATLGWVLTEIYITAAMYLYLRRQGVVLYRAGQWRESLRFLRAQAAELRFSP